MTMTDTTASLTKLASTLRELHRPGTPLVLANVWDASSARLAQEAGFTVVASSSGAVAESLGYADGQNAPAAEMFAAAARIARAVDVPVTVDAEAGYGLSGAELVGQLLAAGAVGCNLEDSDHSGGGLLDPAQQATYLREVRAAADAAGVPIVINARVDVFVRAPEGTDPATLLDGAVERAKSYLAAGADCVYPIMLNDPDVIRAFVSAVAPAPVNLLTTPASHSAAELAKLGAGRVSAGTSIWAGTKAELARRLSELAAN
jgi:2-methylisocitrate lyase-like PEP mutase family enzyme